MESNLASWALIPLSNELRGALLFAVFAILLALESVRPLRKPTQSKRKRLFINVSVAAIAALILRFAFYPIVLKVAESSQEKGVGLLALFGLPLYLEIPLALIALDYTLYIWHQMLHKIPFLWRFHNAHHVDLDLDTSTALRFHFGELILSTFYRSVQIVLFGISPFNLILFETCITAFAQFHHSNIRLPISIERLLGFAIITPRMHGIHHSIVRQETDSNFGTIFVFWDHLHRSFKGNIPQMDITIGVPSYRDPVELTLFGTLSVPFRKQRMWKLPTGTVPERDSRIAPSQRELVP